MNKLPTWLKIAGISAFALIASYLVLSVLAVVFGWLFKILVLGSAAALAWYLIGVLIVPDKDEGDKLPE
jgi:threonine/homoserine/homoserine lactone efflux protein